MTLFYGFRFHLRSQDQPSPSGYQLIASRYDGYHYLGNLLKYPFLPTSIKEIGQIFNERIHHMAGDPNVQAFLVAQGTREPPDLYVVPRDFADPPRVDVKTPEIDVTMKISEMTIES